MTKTRSVTTPFIGAALLWLCAAGVSAGQNRPVPPTPPTPPAPPAAPAPAPPEAFFSTPLPPLPPAWVEPFDWDGFQFFDKNAFKLDIEDFKLNMEDFKANMDSFKDSVKDSVKHSLDGFKFDGNPFPDGLAWQVPNPPNPKPMPGPMLRVGPIFTTPADSMYDSAHDLINSGRYDKAIDQLDRLLRQFDGKADAVANRVDAALYWKAYAQLKESTTADALATLADLQKRFADSRWLKDAKALELEVRQASGQRVSPADQSDEELKLLALRGLMQADPDRALPMIEQLMAGNSSVRVKENALFVLSQSRATRARDIIASVARGNSNPDVQLRAVRYLGTMRTPESNQALDDIYRSASDSAVKREIIRSWVSGDAVDKLSDLLKNEKDLQLRRTAVRSLGGMRRANTGDLLRSAYLADANVDLRRDIVNALASQQNAAILVALAKAEKNPDLKREIVQRLSTMKVKEATDYMLELLK